MTAKVRRIRRKLLSENKMSKYLVYAFGEILLVVIGILIALQVNNWNQKRIQASDEKTLVSQIIADLEQDAKVVAGFIPKIESKRDLIKQIYLEVTDRATFDSTMIYGELPWQTFASLFFEKRHQKSLDKISEDKLRKKLLEYFVLQNTLETQLDQANEYVRENVRIFLHQHDVLNSELIMQTDSLAVITSNKAIFIDHEQLLKQKKSKELRSLLFENRMNFLTVLNSSNRLLDANYNLSKVLKEAYEIK